VCFIIHNYCKSGRCVNLSESFEFFHFPAIVLHPAIGNELPRWWAMCQIVALFLEWHQISWTKIHPTLPQALWCVLSF
jgi:hypothetical protein